MSALRQPYISKSNRRGVVLLLAFLLLIVFIPRFLSLTFPDKFDLTSTEIKIAESLESRNNVRDYSTHYFKKKNRYKIPEQAFDPNTYTIEDWMKLGLSSKQAEVVVRFSAKGINSYEEFEKITVVPDLLKRIIKDSLIFPQKQRTQPNGKQLVQKGKPLVELNTATLEDLIDLPGIGEYTAGKILQYKERLGGFVRTEQLMEIKRIDPEVYAKFDKLMSVDATKVTQININTAQFDTLRSHPYFSYSVANSIIKMRQQKGKFARIEDLMESKLIDQELFEKIKPYLTL